MPGLPSDQYLHTADVIHGLSGLNESLGINNHVLNNQSGSMGHTTSPLTRQARWHLVLT